MWVYMNKDLFFPIRNESDLGLEREWEPDLVVGWLACHGRATKLQCLGSLVTDGHSAQGRTGTERGGGLLPAKRHALATPPAGPMGSMGTLLFWWTQAAGDKESSQVDKVSPALT